MELLKINENYFHFYREIYDACINYNVLIHPLLTMTPLVLFNTRDVIKIERKEIHFQCMCVSPW